MTPADRLSDWGKLLWGSAWHTAMADALRVNRRTIQRWESGANDPPPGVWDELRDHAKQRIQELRDAIHRP